MTNARAFVVVFVLASLMISGSAAHAQQDSERFVRWARANAIPIRSVEPGGDVSDLRALESIIGTARVVAFGEPAHGAHEPLAFRNRLLRFLVEELGFTAIAIESALPESRRVHDFVAGGPGAADQIVRESFSWGFGAFAENEELVQWIRQYNADASHTRKVRFYGIDLSLGGRMGSAPTPAALRDALSYLARVDAMSARSMQDLLEPYLKRLPDASFSTAEHDSMSAAIDNLIALLERKRAAYVAASSEADHAWAHRNVVVARQADRVFRVLPAEAPGGGIPPAAWRAVNARDSAMAENVRWVLEREGPEGRVLLFAHNAHVKNVPTEGGIWSVFEQPPNAMSQYLRKSLGDDLVIISMSSSRNGAGLPPGASDPSSLDRALERVAVPRFMLDLRTSRTDAAAAAWLAQRSNLKANFETFLTLVPGEAFDAILFVDTLSPAHKAPSR